MTTDENENNLNDISKALQTLQINPPTSPPPSNALTILADASRSNPSTRQKLSDPQILRTLTEAIDSSLDDSLETVDLALRCLGNACIDNDAARQQITDLGFAWAVRCLVAPPSGIDEDWRTTQMLVGRVLYNICSDYEPAQERCWREGVHYRLVHLCGSEIVVGGEERGLFVELLFWICSHMKPDSTNEDPIPTKELTTLLKLPSLYDNILDDEEFAMLLETCLLFVRDAAVQRDVVENELVDWVWCMLTINERLILRSEKVDLHEKVLIPLSTSLIWCLSDMAASAGFNAAYGLRSQWLQDNVINTLKSVGRANDVLQPPRLTTAACQILGNVLWSIKEPETFAYLVEAEELHKSLLTLLNQRQDPELLHSAAGLLTQLSRPSATVRDVVGSEASAREALENLCRHQTPQLKQDGIALVRALGRDCPANQERLANLAKEIMTSAAPPPPTRT